MHDASVANENLWQSGSRFWLKSAAAIVLAVVAGGPARAQITTGMWAYYDFETSTITNVAPTPTDYSVATNGSPQSGWSGGTSASTDRSTLLVGNALNLIRTENDSFQLNGIGSGAAAPAGANLNGTFTISAWSYLATTNTSTSSRFYIWENTNDYDLSWGTQGGTSGPDTYGAYNTTAQFLGSASLPRDQWNNIVQTFSSDGTNITSSLFVNGTLRATNSTLLSNMNWSGVRFGNSRGGGGRAWDGLLDEIAIWDTALTGANAQEVYIRGLQGTGLTAATTDVGSWSSTATGNEWTAAADWSGGAVIGATGVGAASSNAVAIFGNYSLATGLGIDMSSGAAEGALGLGAIVLDSASGTLRIGNSSADTNGILQLNGATTGAGANTLLYVAGQSDLVIADSPDAASPGSTTLGVTLGTTDGTISVGTDRTATIESAIGEAAAGSGFTKTGNGTLLLSGTNTFTGTTAISAGTIKLGASDSLADISSLALSGGSFDLDTFNETVNAVTITAPASITGSGALAATTLDVSNASGTATISAGLGGATALTKTGAGSLLLSGTNLQTGATVVNEGSLVLAGPGSLSSGSATSVAAGATLALRPDGGFTGTEVNQLLANTLSGVTMDAAAIAGVDTAGVDATISDSLSGSQPFAKLGTSTLTLTGSNTLSGGTTINAGTLAIGDGGTAGSLTGDVAATGTLAFNRSDDVTYSGVVSGSGGVAQNGSGTLTLSGANTYTGGTVINAGTLAIDRSDDATVAGVISGAGSFQKQGGGTLTLTGANTFTGDTTVAAGTLAFSGSGTTAVGSPLTVQSGAAMQLNRNDTWGTASTSATPVVTIDAGGTVRSNNTYTTLISPVFNGGTLEANDGVNANFPAFGLKGTVGVNATAGGSQITTSGVGDFNTVTIGTDTAGGTTTFDVADGAAAADLSVAVPLTNFAGVDSGLVKSGAGRMLLSATSTYSGGTTVNAGTLAANAAGAVGSGSVAVASGATLEIGTATALQANSLSAQTGSTVSFTAAAGTTYSIGSINGGATLDATGSSLSVGGNNGSSTYSGSITADSLTKAGTGSLTVAGANTLGGVTVNGGTLVAKSAAALGAGTVTLAGGVLDYTMADVANPIALSGAAASNSFSFSTEVEYLVIGGGGGGAGRDVGGGGGAGGYRSSVVGELSGRNSVAEPTLLLSPGTFSVVVGAGGTGGPDQANNTQGKQGGDSSFGSIVATGGGGGNAYNSPAATNGGSGGGGAGLTVLTPNPGLANEGFGGGTGTSSGTSYGGAGGGGAGGAGANATSTRAGGDGIASSITGTSIFRAGGGGGAGHRSTGNRSLGDGGQGGGGAATANGGAASSGTANTGGGGGASRAAGAAGGAGGSGVVIVRYAGSQAATGGTIDTTSVPGYTVHSFTTVGSAENFVLAPTRTISGDISGTGGFSFASPGATLTLSGNNTYSGGTVVNAGTVTVGSATALGTGSLTVNAGGTVAFDTPGVSTHSLPVISGAGSLSAAGKSLSIGADNSSSAFAGSITAASLTKSGTGGLGLSGTNTLGGTTISGGSVTATSSNAFGSGTVTLSGGDLRLGSNVNLANAFTLSADAASTTLGVPTIDYLIVGGGGGGAGRDGGGGGGGGGVLSNLIGRGDALPATGTYAVTVGAGGAGGVNGFTSGTSGQNGGDSILGSLTAVGGGGGSFYAGTAGQGGSPGGSGGGGGRGEVNPNPGAGTAGQGFAGGAGTGGSAAGNAAGGGGGAGGVGQDGIFGVKGGDGGSGIAVSITGIETYYGGGGGGSVYRVPSPADMAGGAGGVGGGGSASTSRGGAPTAGTANTGGGGGASRNDAGNSTGAAGGSGIVVVRYLGDAIATGGTITAGTGENAGYTLHTFTDPGTAELAFSSLAATIAGDIGGTGGFTWDSAARLTLFGNNSYSGGTILSAGTLTAGSDTAFGTGTITLASGTTIDLANYAITNTITNDGGTILNAGNYAGSQTVDGDATFDGDISGTVTIGNGGVGRFNGQVGGRVEIAAGGIAELDDSASVGGAAEFINNGLLRANRATDMTIGRPISGSGSLQKQGAGRLVLSGTNTYTGGTAVDAGALVVNGSILGDVSLAAGSRLGGSGSIAGTVGGSGVFGPGNSPGLTSVGSIDPSGGLSFELEITGTLADWDAPTASINDVIRITDGTPFTAAMSAANTISVLLDVAGLDPAAPGTYTGGFFTDTAADFTSSITNATFDYWVAGEFGALGDRQQFATGSGGTLEWYTQLAAYDPALSVQWSVVPTTADFGSGDVNGYSTQFVVVPEPASLALAGLGLAGLAALLRRRLARG